MMKKLLLIPLFACSLLCGCEQKEETTGNKPTPVFGQVTLTTRNYSKYLDVTILPFMGPDFNMGYSVWISSKSEYANGTFIDAKVTYTLSVNPNQTFTANLNEKGSYSAPIDAAGGASLKVVSVSGYYKKS